MHRGNTNLNGPEAGTATDVGALHLPRSLPGFPQLVAPAGGWDCVKAAVENGADAIYFGLERHNARMRAPNFTLAGLPGLIEFLHRRGVKGFVTFNTLVFDGEMAEAEKWLRAIIAAGVDAAIVQDVGICRLIRRLSPDFPIHASTQMTITSAGGVEFARDLGCSLVVLARECSLPELELIQDALGRNGESSLDSRAQTAPRTSQHRASRPRLPTFPLEVFIHGALCVAYSGQCLTSESLGSRSANRGVCAQACRMPFELIADGKVVPLGDRRYLLSPRDLAGLELLPALIRAGVTSLKIEGRLKSPEYVANITRIYRKALDQLRVELARVSPSDGQPNPTRSAQPVSPEDVYEMEMAFSRGLHSGWLRGVNNKELVHARFAKKRGVYLGEVVRVQGQGVLTRLQGPLKPGDGVVFDAGRPDEEEEGGRVWSMEQGARSGEWGAGSGERAAGSGERRGMETLLTFGRGDVDFRRIHPGDKVWKTSDPELDRRLRQTFAGDSPRFQRPVTLEVHGKADQPLRLIARDEAGHEVEAASTIPLTQAEKQPLTTELLRAQLGRLGGTPFRLGKLKNELQGGLILPVSELNRLRREVTNQLDKLRARPSKWTLRSGNGERRTENGERGTGKGGVVSPSGGCLVVLVRSREQLEAALREGVQTLYCEFEDPKDYRAAVQLARASTAPAGVPPSGSLPEPACSQQPLAPEIFVAPPRILKPGEEWILEQIRACEADGVLVHNYDHLKFFADCRRIGDYSLNIANALSAEYFIHQFKLERVTASYDLNMDQLETLVRSAPPEWFEVTVHQHMPMFHTEHCLFCAFLSQGTDYTNCGRPCEKHAVKLRDRMGAEHGVKADAGCRNTVFNALAQTGAESVSRLLGLGVRHFRIEFLDEPPEQVSQTITRYRQLLRGEISGAQLWRELKLLNQIGVTRGPLYSMETK